MNCAASEITSLLSTPAPQREWSAYIRLQLAERDGRTRLVGNQHLGPLRVQRPFYPEDECCHVYLLHPPGGLVIGDQLQIHIEVEPRAQGLLTTPSAGKVYGAKGAPELQQQQISIQVDDGACLEWLPQETIVFNSANAILRTVVHLQGNAGYAGWDIVRLGRAASGEQFCYGSCRQALEIYRSGRPLFIERNQIIAGSAVQRAVWGLQNRNTFGTLVLTIDIDRAETDELVQALMALDGDTDNLWGITQKPGLLIARYLGNDVALCRRGFEMLWRQLRPRLNGLTAVSPRIWAT